MSTKTLRKSAKKNKPNLFNPVEDDFFFKDLGELISTKKIRKRNKPAHRKWND